VKISDSRSALGFFFIQREARRPFEEGWWSHAWSSDHITVMKTARDEHLPLLVARRRQLDSDWMSSLAATHVAPNVYTCNDGRMAD